MASVVFRIPEIELPEGVFVEACQALIHTVLLNRALGPLRPELREIDTLGLRYACLNDSSLVSLVDNFLATLAKRTEVIGPNLRRTRFSVVFVAQVSRGSFLGISTGTEKREWERWNFSVLSNSGEVAPQPSSAANPSAAAPHHRASASSSSSSSSSSLESLGSESSAVRQALIAREAIEASIASIASLASERTAHIPAIDFESKFALFYKFELQLPPPAPAPAPAPAAAAAPAPAAASSSSAEASGEASTAAPSSSQALPVRWLGDMASFLRRGPPSMF